MGKIISLSGIDGAGKSTQVKYLSEYLKKRGKKIKVTQEMFGYFFLKPLIKFFRSATKSPKEGPVTRNTKYGLFKLWFALAFIDVWLGYFLKIRPMLLKYDYLIADRFYNDIWANLLYYGYIPESVFTITMKLLPKSDVAFLLIVRPEVGKRRSDDFPLSYFKIQDKIYKSLAKYDTYNVIDVNNSSKIVSLKIKEILKNSL